MVVSVSLLVALGFGLLVKSQPAGARRTPTLTIFAAASLTDAFETMGERFASAHEDDVSLVFNFGGSSTLAAQLRAGAPADVFASANPQQMDGALEVGDVVAPALDFAHNRLVIAVPAGNPAGIRSVADLAQPGLLLVLAAPEVPVRVYTDEMLARLAADPAYGAEYRQAVLDNVVSEEANVRQVAAKIAFGEADAGLVYASDITPDLAPRVDMIPVPERYNVLATYPIAVTAGSEQPDLAEQFVTYVLSAEGQAVLEASGFVSVQADTRVLAHDAAPVHTP